MIRFPKKGVWLAAVSGGPDSMAMLAMCLQQGTAVAVAHVNYHQRPQAQAEEASVRAFCQAHQIAFYVRDEAFSWRGNFEAAARKYRYDFFAEIVQEHGYAGILIAHQEDDLIETYLMQKQRQIVPLCYGLQRRGKYHGVPVVRPLLHQTKAALEHDCQVYQIPYWIDATNLQDQHTRNRLRHTVVAQMNQSQRQAVEAEIRSENRRLAQLRRQAAAVISGGRVSLAAYRGLDQEVRLTVIRRLGEDLRHEEPGISRRHLLEIDQILLRHDDFVIPLKGRRLVQADGSFFCRAQTSRSYCYTLDRIRAMKTPWFRVSRQGTGVNAVSVQAADFPLCIRSVRDGDRIRLRYGTKSVHRFFVDRHIPLYQRPLWPVVENARGQIILVPGIGCNIDHYTIKPDFYVLQYEARGGRNHA